MTDAAAPISRHFRARVDGQHEQATTLELFFDLVYVFAITQLTATLAADISLHGVLRATLMLLMVWWAWNYTTWMSNWFDPHAVPVRLVLMGVMLLSLTMSVAIPTAFAGAGMLFACSYVGLQVGRNLFNVLAVPSGVRRASFLRILIWSLAAGAFWIEGAQLHDSARVACWIIALAVDYLGPAARYWVPGMHASAVSDWDIEPHHFAERFQLLVIIALGEGIVVIGSGATGLTGGAALATLVTGFLTTACMWWIYFDYVAESAQRRLARSSEPGRMARDGFTYLHLPIVAGIILYAVSLKLVMKHPLDPLHGGELAITLAGPLMYLLGHNAFRLRMTGTISAARFVTAGAMLALAMVAGSVGAIYIAMALLVLLATLAAWESVAIRRFYGARPDSDQLANLRHVKR